MINRRIKFIIRQFLINLLDNRLSIDQPFDLIAGLNIGHIHKPPYNGISTGIQPIVLRRHLPVIPVIRTVIDHIPRAVYIFIAKRIPIIPLFYGLAVILQSILSQHIAYFLVRKTKILIKRRFRNRIHFKIIQPRENTFLGDPQTASQHSHLQTVIGFQHASQHSTNQRYHLIIVSMLKCLIQRHIVLINQNDHLSAIMLF